MKAFYRWLDEYESWILFALWLTFAILYGLTSWTPYEIVEDTSWLRYADGVFENNRSEFVQLLVACQLGKHFKDYVKATLAEILANVQRKDE